ncbi:MAG: PAS domain-containing protein, partial [Candidatus Sericytochromatia bacterium]
MSERIDLQAAASGALLDLEWVGARFVHEARGRKMPAIERLDLDEAELLAVGRHRMGELLEHLARGDRAGYLAKVIARYEEGETSGQRGLGKEALSLTDLVQALTAQKLAFLAWVGLQPYDGATVAAIAIELEHLYGDIQAAYARTHAAIQKDFVQRLIEHAPAAIAYLDQALIIRWINPAFTELTGWSQERVIDQTLTELAHDFDWHGPVGRQLLEATAPVRVPGVPYAPDALGELRYWDVTWVPMHDEGDRLAGYLLLVLDASERVENERLQAERISALEETDRLKDQFLSILSHELRTPINAIMGFGSILDDELLGPLS